MNQRDEIEKVLRKRVRTTCQGTAAYAVGVREDWTCRNVACIGRILCSQHGGEGPPRYIQPKDLPKLLDELVNALIPQTEESSA